MKMLMKPKWIPFPMRRLQSALLLGCFVLRGLQGLAGTMSQNIQSPLIFISLLNSSSLKARPEYNRPLKSRISSRNRYINNIQFIKLPAKNLFEPRQKSQPNTLWLKGMFSRRHRLQGKQNTRQMTSRWLVQAYQCLRTKPKPCKCFWKESR